MSDEYFYLQQARLVTHIDFKSPEMRNWWSVNCGQITIDLLQGKTITVIDVKDFEREVDMTKIETIGDVMFRLAEFLNKMPDEEFFTRVLSAKMK